MKKIIAVATMAAMVAGAAFAAEASATVKASGSLFSYENDTVSALTLGDLKGGDTAVEFKVEGEKIGASVKIKNGSTTPTISADANGDGLPEVKVTCAVFDDASLWFKPFDVLKVSLGSVSAALPLDTLKVEGKGTDLQVTAVSGLTFDLVLASSDYGKAWYDGSYVALTAAKVAYKLEDVGTASVLFAFNNAASEGDLQVGAGFSGSAASLSYDLGAGIKVNTIASSNNLKEVDVNAKVAYSADPFAADAKVTTAINPNGSTDAAKTNVGVEANASYKLGDVTAYAKVAVADVITDSDMEITLKPGVKGSIGEGSWDVAVETKITGSKVKVSVPASVKVSF
jgi:hypothetical protein